jgi:photosystem II stability/assembly factor-like uncharacterized protein
MSKIVVSITLVICFLPLVIFPQDGWINQIKPTNASLNDIQSPDTLNYWVVGDSGLVYTAFGGPGSFVRQISNITQNLFGVFFLRTGEGWAVGDNGTVIHSANFGNQWELVSMNTTLRLNDICFIDNLTGLIVGDSGLLLETKDAGSHWVEKDLSTNFNLNKIEFSVNSGLWLVGDSGMVLQSNDSGLNWEEIHTGYYSNINNICILNYSDSYLACDQGLILRTLDNGMNWEKVSFPLTNNLNGVICHDSERIWAYGEGGTLFYSENAGSTWDSSLEYKSGIDINMAVYRDDSYSFVTDSGFQVRCFDFPESAFFQKIGMDINLLSIDFVNNETGFAAGYGSTFLYTHNGGENWWPYHLGDFTNTGHYPTIKDFDFIDENRGWLITHIGYASWIFSSGDGGQSWTQQYYNADLDLYGINFYDDSTGWAWGDKGIIVHTSNAGADWTVIQESNMPDETICKIRFNNPQDGYLVYLSGTFWVTHDGGANWTQLYDFGSMVRDFCVQADTVIWTLMLGYSDVNKSTDGGYTWVTQPLPVASANTSSIFFLNENEGWATGDWEVLWHTSDGGDNWELLFDEDNDNAYRKIIFTDENHAWITCGKGAILHGPGLYVSSPETKQTKAEKLLIYPNPSSGEIIISFPGGNQHLSIWIYDGCGNMIFNKNWPGSSNSFSIDLEKFVSGVYYSILKNENSILASGKFLVLK